MTRLLMAILVLTWLASPVWALDPRLCGTPARTADGGIARNAAMITEFKSLHPCPSTGKTKGPCPGWAVDHILPLACHGCDAVINMQWLKTSIKSCAGPDCKDRWERKIYCLPMQIVK